jgi:hypothetical protein
LNTLGNTLLLINTQRANRARVAPEHKLYIAPEHKLYK